MTHQAVDWAMVRAMAGRSLLPAWFMILSVDRIVSFIQQGYLGIDIRIYRAAALAMINGGDPWAVGSGGTFAAPPPTLIFYVPAALVPLPLATLAAFGVGIASALYIVRRLNLPLWWMTFPPLVEGVLVGNPDAPLTALLLMSGPVAGLAVGIKVYAAIPLLAQRRWAAMAVAAAVCLISFPVWPRFFADLGTVSTTLATGTAQLSAWGSWLMIPVVVALWVLRGRGAGWLAVPALWPYTQSHYATISIPALHRFPMSAAIMALAIPLAPAVAVIVAAVAVILRDDRVTRIASGGRSSQVLAAISGLALTESPDQRAEPSGADRDRSPAPDLSGVR